MKSLDDIWDEYVKNDCISSQTLKDLAWHIEHDETPVPAFVMATDMNAQKLSDVIAAHLNNEDNFVREVAVSCLIGRLRRSEYAERAFQMAKEDTGGAQALAISCIGAVLGQTRDPLRTNIAQYLIDLLYDEQEDELTRKFAYYAINDGLGIPIEEVPSFRKFSFKENADKDLVERFKKVYGVKEKK